MAAPPPVACSRVRNLKLIISVNNMTNSLASLHCCAWRTVSLRATEMAAAQASMRARHEGAAIMTSCQRLEAYSLHPCACDAPEQLDGFAALERLAAVAAGFATAVRG